jgi:hypothetical protein
VISSVRRNVATCPALQLTPSKVVGAAHARPSVPATPAAILGVGSGGAAVMLRSEDALFHNGRSRDILYGRPRDISIGWLDLGGGGQRTLRSWIGHNLTVRDGA